MPGKPVLIVGLSGRSLAASARRAGYAPIVLDAFDDLDTQACALASERVPIDDAWRFDEARLLAAAQRLAPPPVPLVWCSGFERATSLLEKLAEGRTLYGNDAVTAAQTKDPFAFADRLAELGIAHPEVCRRPPVDPEGWLIKRIGGAGGTHIRPATLGAPPGEDEYYQCHVPGRPVSALILGDGGRARTLSFSEQWADPAPGGRAFRFGGCAVPARLSSIELGARLARAAETVVVSYALRGIGSVDFLVQGDRFHLLEVNPRPGASLDACEQAHGVSLFEAHVHASRGDLGKTLSPPRRAAASAIVYARNRLIVPHGMDWPAWAADRGQDGTVIFPGHPICTVFGEGVDASEARRQACHRAETMLTHLDRATAALHAAWAAGWEALADASA
jgi:predicted ATP-grasp superfamily ATP-dependent carboligase